MALSDAEREALADRLGLKREALRWARGETREELEADIRELLDDRPGLRASSEKPPTRTPHESLSPSDEDPEPGTGPLTADDFDRMLDDRPFDTDATRVAAEIEGSLR